MAVKNSAMKWRVQPMCPSAVVFVDIALFVLASSILYYRLQTVFSALINTDKQSSIYTLMKFNSVALIKSVKPIH